MVLFAHWRGVRVVECTAFEKRQAARPRGFESLPLRQIETSSVVRAGRKPRREAAKVNGAATEKCGDVSSKTGFVPTFCTNCLIAGKLSDELKKLACFKSKIHSRRGSTRFFLPRSKSFNSAFKAARERMRVSFFARYISFGTSSSKYADTSFSMRSPSALILAERF